jgi:hypothetical protein
LKSKFAIKPKQKYNNKVEVAIDKTEGSDEEDYNEFQKFKEMKKQKKLDPKPKPEESDDDGFIQNKQKKAVAVIETINKLDTAISKINSNPYLAIFNQKL